ncbi:MAG: Mov34/MPN/PAD-1 family protein [Gemmatimonadetes bacterium]|nr:Mov34/MPN/PAD-1 family protein [Gemmatimonadota bacterium]
MYLLPIDQIEQFLTHVQAAFPREASGLLLRREWKRFTVLSFVATSSEENTRLSFRIRDAAINTIAESLRASGTRICGCAHSHNFGKAFPSSHDCAATKGPCTLWMIYSVPRRDLKLFVWDGTTFHKERFRIIP